MVRPLAAAAALSVLLAGCGQSTAQDADADPDAAAATQTTEAPDEPEASAGKAGKPEKPGMKPTQQVAVPETLEFTGTTVSGDRLQGASLAGRPTLFWFWAPWCPTCRGQIPQVQGLASEHEGELNVVGIGSLDSADAIAGFAGDAGGVTHLEDAEGELWRRFEVTEQSSFVLLDESGKVAFRTGYGGEDDLDAEVAGVLD